MFVKNTTIVLAPRQLWYSSQTILMSEPRKHTMVIAVVFDILPTI
jgi:hypothetical protein